mmetsp:Transcript_11709/g.17176  ORF Transcript_11709/g.17176 Transcript_11709/m.17176 type:complete len:468 (-) Transcript_11709:33-1436(-)
MCTPRVILLLTTDNDDSLLSSSQMVSKHLIEQFGIMDVTIRSAMVPSNRFRVDDSHPTLWAVLQTPDSPHFSTSTWDQESTIPCMVLKVSSSNSDQRAVALHIAKICGLASPSIRDKIKTFLKYDLQRRLVVDAEIRTKSHKYEYAIARCFDENLQITGKEIECPGAEYFTGKVRDRFLGTNSKMALVTTDRQSGFDRQLAIVPFKGAVLNLTSAFWFHQTQHIIGNHLIDVPHPNVSIVRKCKPFPIEFVVRSYMTGSTDTSIWKNYQNGVRDYCGHLLPEGMTKNKKLAKNLLTPTTKEEDHDRPISAKSIVEEGWMTHEDFDVCAKASLGIFALGQEIATEHGMILVDTKYEFGKDLETGEILLIDEVHTPDSSRWWLAHNYEERVSVGLEPDNISKEFLRLWYRENCDPYKDKIIPDAPRDLVRELARRYITLYEIITWKDFEFNSQKSEKDIGEILVKCLSD